MKTLNYRLFQIFILSILLTTIKSCKTDSNNKLKDSTNKIVLDKKTKLDSKETEIKKFKSIKIGNQEWMNEDLKVEIFLNGDSIFHATTNKEWALAIKNEQPAWCYAPNKQNQIDKFYNIYVLKDKRGIIPNGWKIPSNFDWNILANHINDSHDSSCGNCWVHIPKSVKSYQFNNKNNGFRFKDGNFYSLNKNSFYWTSNYTIATTAIGSELLIKYGSIIRLPNENFGLQIRCIKK